MKHLDVRHVFVEALLHTGQRLQSLPFRVHHRVGAKAMVYDLFRHLLGCTMVERVIVVCEETGEVLLEQESFVAQLAKPPEPG